MIQIDAHQHFWRYSPQEYAWVDESMRVLRRDFLPEHLRGEMTRAGVDATVAVQARQTLEETHWLLELADANPFVAGIVGWVDLQAVDIVAQLSRLATHRKLVGLRHIVQSERDDRFLLRPAFCRGIATLRDFGLAYDILIYPRHLPVAAELVRRFPDQRFVLDHLGKPEIRRGAMDGWQRDLRALARSPNVFCKVSGLVTEADWSSWRPEQIYPYLDAAFEAFGADRLLAGSDWPVCTVAAGYSRTMAVVSDYLEDRSPAERAAVLGGTACSVYALSVPGLR